MCPGNLSQALQFGSADFQTYSRLQGLSRDLLARVVERSTVRTYAKGEILFAAGDEEVGLYGIEQGSVLLSVDGPDVSRRILTVQPPGSWIGLISAIDRKPKMHDAYASEPSLIRRLPAKAFDEISGTDAGYMRQFAVLLASQTRLSIEGMLDASSMAPSARLAKRLLNFAELFGADDGTVAIDISQDDLAALLGTSRQTINRTLRDWEDRGWIALRYRRLRIVEPAKLRGVRLGNAG
jgi:CRP/FNR family transcriptional regulator, cyclic AMP receptor protein